MRVPTHNRPPSGSASTQAPVRTGRPFRPNPYADLIRRKGDEHEAEYLATLGEGVVEIGDPRETGWNVAATATEEAIRDAAPIMYQAALVDEGWRGLADFLELQPDGFYEVADTKLARTAKPYFLLQLAFYSEQVGRIQGRLPERQRPGRFSPVSRLFGASVPAIAQNVSVESG